MSPHKVRREALKYGYRSGLEHSISLYLKKLVSSKSNHERLALIIVVFFFKESFFLGFEKNNAELPSLSTVEI